MRKRNEPVFRTQRGKHIARNALWAILKMIFVMAIGCLIGAFSSLVFYEIVDFSNGTLTPIHVLLNTLFGITTGFKLCFGGFIGKHELFYYVRGEDVVSKLSNRAYMIILAVFVALQCLIFVVGRLFVW